MYNPPWFKEEDLARIRGEITRLSFGTLVTTTQSGGVLASHIPMILDESEGEKGTLYGHIARGNLQWRDSKKGAEGLAIFLGPDAYITPRWYETKKETGEVVPTWNYVAIHARGPVTFFDDSARLRKLVTRLTTKHESRAERPWKVSDAPDAYIEKELKAIVGFEMPIARVEGKWKMSQNRPEPDRRGVIEGLAQRNEAADADVSGRMRAREARG